MAAITVHFIGNDFSQICFFKLHTWCRCLEQKGLLKSWKKYWVFDDVH
jgi:hypothetical protein